MTAAGIAYDASDASKAYPSTPTDLNSAPGPGGRDVLRRRVQAVPRYPSNVYYNASRQAQQLDEYNWIYRRRRPAAMRADRRTSPPAGRRRRPGREYVASENRVMFRHVVDNDPRPHYIHQSNLADYNPALPETDPGQGGIAYPVFGGLAGALRGGVRPHHGAADRAHAHADRPDARAAGRVGGDADGREGHRVDGRRQGPRQERRDSGGRRAGHRHRRRHALRRREVGLDHGRCRGRAGARAGRAARHRPCRPTRHASRPAAAATTNPGSNPTATPSSRRRKPRATRLTLTKVKMSPRRFAVSHKRSRAGTRLDGSRITFKVSTNSSVRLIVQRRSSGRHKRWVERRHDHPLGQGGHRRGALHRALRQAAAQAARLPARGHRQARRAGRAPRPRRLSFRVVKG